MPMSGLDSKDFLTDDVGEVTRGAAPAIAIREDDRHAPNQNEYQNCSHRSLVAAPLGHRARIARECFPQSPV